MNWKFKAKIQCTISSLPPPISDTLYYCIQRKFGGFKRLNHFDQFIAGIELVKKIKRFDGIIKDKVFFELGTGRRLGIPILLWLLGAERIITADLYPYLKKRLVEDDIDFLSENNQEIINLLKDHDLNMERFEMLMSISGKEQRLSKSLDLFNIQYIAPCDASHLTIPDKSIDYYFSYNVLEHIPPNTILSILNEGNRLLKEDGFYIKRIDFSDHFSHSDRKISSINFLQFNEKHWDEIAGNRYSFTNRIRVDDCINLFQNSKLKILSIESEKDLHIMDLLNKKQIKLDVRFESKSLDVLSTMTSWFIMQKC